MLGIIDKITLVAIFLVAFNTAGGIAQTTTPASVSPCKSLSIQSEGASQYKVTFFFRDTAPNKVFLAGSFNDWNPAKDIMTKTPEGFSISMTLPEGGYQYKFVADDGQWKPDPDNPESTDDNRGGQNSVLLLGPGAQIRKSEAKSGDGVIAETALHHDPGSTDYLKMLPDGAIVFKLRSLANDIDAARVIILASPRQPVHIKNEKSWAVESEGPSLTLPMQREFTDERFTTIRVKASSAILDEFARKTGASAGKHDNISSAARVLNYIFSVKDGNSIALMGSDGTTTDIVRQTPACFTAAVNSEGVFRTPDWARTVVWYDIFPERFRNGLTANDPAQGTRPWTSEWSRLMPWDEEKFYPSVFFRRYGGDLKGVIEKLPYIKELGIGAIWFNPLFQSKSLHKYDATDYRHIDDGFGFAGSSEKTSAQEDLLDAATWQFSDSDKLFLELISKAHATGIKVIIDGVFNHSGTDHPAFKDIVKNKQNSRFKDWYNVTQWEPFEYEGWFGSKDLPVFKENEKGYVDPSLRKHIMDITRRWMDPNGDGDPSDGVDGWRLDVPNEISSEWWKEWRKEVKRINPSALIMGEIWDPPQQWVRGDQFDCVMNYQFSKAMHNFFINGGKASAFDQELAKTRISIPEQSAYVMMNLMNSHDTDRLVSMINNPGRRYDEGNRVQDLKPGQVYKDDKPSTDVYTKLKMVAAVQFTYVGSPMIYYGDEAGMWGADDPNCRKPMIWKDLEPYENPGDNYFMRDVYDVCQRCAAIRNSFKALQTGEYETLLADDASSVFAFRRWNDKEALIIAANNSTNTTEVMIPLWQGAPGAWIDLLRDKTVKVVPGDTSAASKTRIETGAGQKPLRAADGKLPVRLEPMTAVILLGR
ncbi:MAG: alpha-amylase family glycosyl hydrolase [Candidatus Sumerlaeota bacterium]|nr:alpha-amylase family glycosyl hydrolase [Candidatus Sumerlaeota bacterium]